MPHHLFSNVHWTPIPLPQLPANPRGHVRSQQSLNKYSSGPRAHSLSLGIVHRRYASKLPSLAGGALRGRWAVSTCEPPVRCKLIKRVLPPFAILRRSESVCAHSTLPPAPTRPKSWLTLPFARVRRNSSTLGSILTGAYLCLCMSLPHHQPDSSLF
jgi:hypothetical protein